MQSRFAHLAPTERRLPNRTFAITLENGKTMPGVGKHEDDMLAWCRLVGIPAVAVRAMPAPAAAATTPGDFVRKYGGTRLPDSPSRRRERADHGQYWGHD